MSSRTLRPKAPQNGNFKPRSSAAARRLIEATMARGGGMSMRQAVEALGLRDHNQLYRMRHGLIGDTPEMKAALLLANARARRAWRGERKPRTPKSLDVEKVQAQLTMLIDDAETLRALLKNS